MKFTAKLTAGTALVAATLFALPALAQDACKYRGDLDTQYCDENKDLVADPPKDAKRYKTPNTLVFTYTPVEDPAVYEQAIKPFTDQDRKSTRLNSSHVSESRMPSSA